MAETWTVRTEASDTQGYDGDAALAWDTPFAVVNESSADIIEVRKLAVELAHCADLAQGFLGSCQLRRITAISGGEALTPEKHLSTAANLPSQVSVVRRPSSVTTNGVYRRVVPIGMLRAGVISSVMNFPRVKADTTTGGGGSHLGAVFSIVDSSSEQAIVLREGEGIALYSDTGSAPFDMRLNFVLVVQGTSATFSCLASFSPAGVGRAVAAVFNGSGSGIVLELRTMVIADEAEPNNVLPKYRVLFGPMKLIGGQDLTPQKTVTTTPNLSAAIKLKRNAFVRLDQWRTEPWWLGQEIFHGAAGELDQFHPIYAHQRIAHRVLDWQRVQRPPHAMLELPWLNVRMGTAMQGWTLRNGEGLAVVFGAPQARMDAALGAVDVQPSTFQNHDFVAVFTRSAAPPAAGGGYSRSRVVNV